MQCQSPAHRCLHSQGQALNEDNVGSTTPGTVTGNVMYSFRHTKHTHTQTLGTNIMKAGQSCVYSSENWFGFHLEFR